MSVWRVVVCSRATHCFARRVSLALSCEVPDMSTANDRSADRETWERVEPNPSDEALGYSIEDERIGVISTGKEPRTKVMYDRENADAWIESTLVIEFGGDPDE